MALTLVTSDLIGGLDYSKLTGTVPTWNQNTTGSAATLTTARNVGGVSFNGSAAIDLPGVNTAGNQNTSGNAGTVTNGVYTVGNQTIGGTKTFSSATTFQLSALTNPSGVDANTVLTIKNNGWSGITMLSSAAAGSFLTFGDADAGFRGRIQYLQGSTDAMVFETAASEKMRITSDGNVGIAKSPSTYRLDLETTSGGNGLKITRGTADFQVFQAANGASYVGTGNADTLHLITGGSSKMSISSGGVVNINTTGSGPNKLQLQGTMTVWYDSNFNRSASVLYDGLYVVGQTGYLWNNGSHHWVIGTNGTERMRISSGGEVSVNNKFSQNSVGRRCNSGYTSGNSSFSIDYTVTSQSSLKVTAVFNHYGLIPNYGCARFSLVGMGPNITAVEYKYNNLW